MKGIVKYLLALLVFCGLSCSSNSDFEHSAAQDEILDEALGYYAEGLFVFDEDSQKGIDLLLKAVQQVPSQRQFVDDFLKFLERKILKESSLSDETSDFEKLHTLIINSFKKTVESKRNENYYIRLKLLESYLAIDKPDEAEKLLKNQTNNKSPHLMMAFLKYYQYKNDVQFLDLLKQILVEKSFKTNAELQYYAVLSLATQDDVEYQDLLLAHTLQLIKTLAFINERSNIPNLCSDLINGVLMGSDIGEEARIQSVETLNPTSEQQQWSLLAGILMKLEHFEEAYIVIKSKVLRHSDSWLAFYNLARCALELGKNKERIAALEKAFQLKRDSSFLMESLIYAHTSRGNRQRALKLIESINVSGNVRLSKVKFYIHKDLKQYNSAFTLAEKIYTWPDFGQRLNTLTPSFALSTIPVYLEVGKSQLLVQRLQKAIKYHSSNISFHNSVAYLLSDAGLSYEWADELMKIVMSSEPDNPSYLDTLAWLRYKQQLYPEALKLINRAIVLSPKCSAEVFLHAGDIYLQNNKRKEAEEYWQKAVMCDTAMQEKVDMRMKSENSSN